MTSIKKPDPYKFKKILSLIREEDFAHAGEKEAIEIALKEIPRSPNHKSLDVGCGLGGTAERIRKQGYGEITGVDISADNIQHAKRKYPDITFIQCDVLNICENIKDKFELIYLFNSFYSFSDQAKALIELRKIAENGETNLVIFDYTDLGDYNQNRPETIYNNLPNPIKIKEINNLMEQSGWKIYQQQDLTKNYEKWYENLLKKILNKQKQIVSFADKNAFEYTYNIYNNILQSIKNKHLGGALILAKPL